MSTDAIVLLENDHKEVRALFREVQKPEKTPAQKGQLVSKILELLTVRTYIENEVIYRRSAGCCQTSRTMCSSRTRSTMSPTSSAWSCP